MCIEYEDVNLQGNEIKEFTFELLSEDPIIENEKKL